MITHLLAAVMAAGLTVGATPVQPAADAAALAQAAREYRIQVYETFHLDRAEYDRREAEWVRLEAAWQAADRPEKELPSLLNWLAQATAASQPESIGALPEAPKIVADPEAQRKAAAPWRLVVPPHVETSAAPATKSKTPAAATDSHRSGNPATPVSSKSTLQGPLLAAPQPADETAPVPPAATPHADAPAGDAPQPTAAATHDSWIFVLGQAIGNELNELAPTTASQPESK